ncbi:hypothetical protein Aros01_07164 [Streptosporangium roseum]|uniref:Uncharacterized protein n=1 Tax=Streptosporangium roseum (strain ATCC 12428 / DSM 43021 / JCM 3005 / KCTC 9067 / NCIMB 10171 / NRRL 2505 / NI 9100) TaxID=479432 RepID=D2B1U4_STRRD|nr:hypothetical protein Sros_4531 [Streptosporangium roseum DSM 43021]
MIIVHLASHVTSDLPQRAENHAPYVACSSPLLQTCYQDHGANPREYPQSSSEGPSRLPGGRLPDGGSAERVLVVTGIATMTVMAFPERLL